MSTKDTSDRVQSPFYADLLSEAHEKGLQSIKTEVVMFPTPGFPVAIVQAQVITPDGTFTGIGDASAENVHPDIAPHYIRMAETRAKARALRDALNIGVAAFEEFGEGGASDFKKTETNDSNGNGKRKMSQAQFITILCRDRQVDIDLELDIRRLWEKKGDNGSLPKSEASRIIERLKQCPKKEKAVA